MVVLRYVAPLAAALSLASGALALAEMRRDRHPVALNGHDWQELTSSERSVYAAGFIAGAAAHQAMREGGHLDGARVAARAARLSRSGSLAFSFRENVYLSHLHDYFFYRDRLDRTLIQAIVELHGAGVTRE